MDFPADTNPHYLVAVLMGIAAAEAQIDLGLLTALVRRCHESQGRPCGRWIAGLLSKYAASELAAEVIAILGWYGLHDPDPNQELSRIETTSGQRHYGGDPHLHGINTVRGAVAETVSALIFVQPARAEELSKLCERLVTDPTIAVRSCAAEICTALLLRAPERAVDLFNALVDDDEALLAVQPIERFLYYALGKNFAALRPTLVRMLASSDDVIAQAGARQACLAAFSIETANPLMEEALHGRPALRRGTAEIYARNLFSGPDRARCEATLATLFHDAHEEVRRAAVGFL